MVRIELSPGFDDVHNFKQAEISECKIMRWRECDDIALASNSFCTQQTRGDAWLSL